MKRRVAIALFAAGVLACLATAPARSERNYPAWEFVQSPKRVLACGALDAWVAKSGKAGMGVVVQLTAAADKRCQVTVVGARFNVAGQWVLPRAVWSDGGSVDAGELGAVLSAKPGEHKELYLPFQFDNETLWNEHKRQGALIIAFDLDGQPQPDLELPMEHLLRGFHKVRLDEE